MRHFAPIHIPVLSFYLKDLYREVSTEWRGTCFLYLFMLLAVCLLPDMANVHRAYSAYVQKDLPPIVAQLPEISIRNGVASIAAPQPYFVNDPKTKKPLIILDTTGRYTSLKNSEAVCLVTATAVLVKLGGQEAVSFPFEKGEHTSITRHTATAWLETSRRYAAATFYPVVVASSFIFRVIQVLLLALAGVLFANTRGIRLPYLAQMRIAVVAITPGIIVLTVLDIAGLIIPYGPLWLFLSALAYQYFGVHAATAGPGNDDGDGQQDSIRD